MPKSTKLSKAIAITLCRRPEATKKLLDCLRNCRGIEDYTLYISVDVDDRYRDNSIEVNDIVIAFQDELQALKRKVFTYAHEPKLGVDLHKLFILGEAFKDNEYVIFLEDDTPISVDALNWFEWAGQHYKDDESVFSVCGFNFTRNLEGVDPYTYQKVRGYNSWGVGLWRDKHAELFGVDAEKYKVYAVDHVNGQYDHFVNTTPGLSMVRPEIARSIHSEWELAEHTPSKEWFEEHEKVSFWAGALEREIALTKAYTEIDKPRKNLKILIDCDGGGSPGGWWPDSHLEGKFSGGSEEQVMYTAKEMTRLGHKVTLRNDCREHSGFHEGVNYVHYADSTIEDIINFGGPIDVYCAQRNKNLLRDRKAPVQILLCHDIPVSDHMFTREEVNEGALEHTDIVVLLNEYHQRLYIDHGVPEYKTRVCPIMIPLEPFNNEVERIPGRCVYCSCPERGLTRLMDYWPEIKRLAPHATLQICWRFSIAHDRAHDYDRPWFEKWEHGDEALGILPLRNCSHEELAIELSKAELLTYPSHFNPEISPAATIKAQMAGAVPLVVIAGGMTDTVQFGHRADFGDFHIATSNALNDVEWQQKQRPKMMQETKWRYDPARVAEIWDDIIQEAFANV